MDLKEAAGAGDSGAVRAALAGLDPKKREDLDLLDEALWAAVEAGQIEAAKLLRAAGGRPEGTFRHPLHIAAGSGMLAAVRVLLALGYDPNQPNEESDGQTPLINSVVYYGKKTPGVVAALIEGGAKMDATDSRGWTALLYSVSNKLLPEVEVLVKAGADVNLRNKDGESALMLAAGMGGWNDRARAVQLLREAGADETGVAAREIYACADSGDVEGLKALLAVERKPEELDGGLHAAIFRNRGEMVAMLLSAGARPERDGSSLITAVQRGTLEMVKTLVGAGADVLASNEGQENRPALWWAKVYKRQDVIDYLEPMSAQPPRVNPFAGRYGVESVEVYRYMMFVEAPIERAAGAVAKVMNALNWEKDVLGRFVTPTESSLLAVQLQGHDWTAFSTLTLAGREDFWKAGPEVAKAAGGRALVLSSADDPDFVRYVLFSGEGGVLEELSEGGAEYFRETFESDPEPSDRDEAAQRRSVVEKGGVIARSQLRDVSGIGRKDVEEAFEWLATELKLLVPPFGVRARDGETIDLSLIDIRREEAVRMDFISLQPTPRPPRPPRKKRRRA